MGRSEKEKRSSQRRRGPCNGPKIFKKYDWLNSALFSERENAIIQTNQDLIAENRRLLDQLNQTESTLKTFEHQCNILNDDLKMAIDKLSREHTIQHVLEANNALSRNMAKMKELLNSHWQSTKL